jgi:hypothetical protein
LTYVVAVREMEPQIRASVFALVQVAMMGGQAAVAVLAGGLADWTSVERSVALWQLPTVALSTWVLIASLVGVVFVRVTRRRGRHHRTPPVPWVARPALPPAPAGAFLPAHAPSSALVASISTEARSTADSPSPR